LRFRRLIRHVHGLGPRPCAELILRLERDHGIDRQAILGLLEEFAEVTPALVRWAGARDWPQVPLEPVP
jgi:hypothetical protein